MVKTLMASELGSLAALREVNRLRVVDALRERGTASRSELARVTGLSRTTVSTLVADLAARGLVVERAAADDLPRSASRGRPPTLLRLDPTAGAALGVAFGPGKLRVAVADLSAAILAEEAVDVDIHGGFTGRPVGAKDALDAAAETVRSVLGAANVDASQVIGAGLGLPAPIDRRTGTVSSHAILVQWPHIRPADELARRLGVHVELDNDANLGARGELRFGAGRGLEDFVYVKHTVAVGSALVLGGRLYRGATGIAGELGHVHVRGDGVVCPGCGNRGCLGPEVSLHGLLDLLRPAYGESLDLDGVLDLVERGDLGARRVLDDTGRAIGRALADLCNHLNPEAIVVGGELSVPGGPLLAGIRESIDRYALPAAAAAVELRAGELGERAEVLGALALVIGDTERLPSAALPPRPRAVASGG
jgi:predicted NBD/HSP70 family sugar kinase